MEYKEISLECVDSKDIVIFEFRNDLSIGWLSTYTLDGQAHLEISKEKLKEFATNILKELEDELQGNET